MIRFRKISDGWALVGPAAELSIGRTVKAVRRDGTTVAVVVGQRLDQQADGLVAHRVSETPPAGSSSADLERATNRLLGKAGFFRRAR